MKKLYVLSCALIATHFLLCSHPLDFHCRGPEEDQLEKEIEQKNALTEYNDIFSNPESTQEEKDAATDRLDKAGILA